MPKPKRRYGYFVLPILRRGQLIGRLDAKAERKAGVFRVKALFVEPGLAPDDAIAADLAATLHRCAAWHATPEVVVERVEPAAWRPLLLRGLGA